MITFRCPLRTSGSLRKGGILTKERIYLAALLHDIGKLIERSKVYENKKVNEQFQKIKYSHARYTAFFLKSYLSKDDWINVDKDKLLKISSYHHNPESEEGRVIQFADWLASSERERDEENTSQYNTVQLRSIFGTLNNEKIDKYYKLRELAFNNLLPVEKDEIQTREFYHDLSNKMIEEFRQVKSKDDLLFFLEKYFSFIPAQTTKSDPDISLFDHSKLTAAIAVCLFHQIQKEKLDDKKIKDYLKRITEKEQINDEQFIFINADLSGIQNYIFNIPSKGAAKSLKGRSIYLVLLMEAISEFIIRELDLERANIIYNGGGNFYILAPEVLEEKIKILRKEINRILFDVHKGQLFCNIGYTKIKLFEFGYFNNVWKRVSNETSKTKQKKLSDIWEDKYNEIFEPKEMIEQNNYCSVCHSTENVEQYDENRLCSLCHSFEDLTKNVSKANYEIFSETHKNKFTSLTYQSILNKLGFEVNFYDNYQKSENGNIFVINEFGDERTIKWKLGALNLPINKKENVKTFEELAGENGKLAYLKLDVDNLGELFKKGLKKPSLSRMSVLSRFLRMFFEGFIPNYIKRLNLEDKIYIVFSGGDDTFLIGDVETILDFTKKLKEKFNKFVCGNKTITFSAGIGIFRYNFPIIKAAQITEKYLEEAKELVYPDETQPSKNKVTIFDEVFTWNEFNYILELFNEIKDLITENSSAGRGIIQKIINSTKGWKPLLDSAQKGKLSSQKIWRLRYFLRTAAQDTKERIIRVYEKMWMENLYIDKDNKEYEIKNHQIITVAAKLADLQTRK